MAGGERGHERASSSRWTPDGGRTRSGRLEGPGGWRSRSFSSSLSSDRRGKMWIGLYQRRESVLGCVFCFFFHSKSGAGECVETQPYDGCVAGMVARSGRRQAASVRLQHQIGNVDAFLNDQVSVS